MLTLGIDFGGTGIKLGLIDDGRLTATHTIPATSTPADLDAVEHAVSELLDRHESPVAEPAVEAVGIALPGVISADGSRLLAAHEKYGYAHHTDIRGWGERTWSVPCVIENDGRAALIGEGAYGCARGVDDFVMITLGTGIGTSAMMAGRPIRGVSGHAGILGGHVTVDIHGQRCQCGNLGCAEAVASTWTITRHLDAIDANARGPYWTDKLARGSVGFVDVVAALSDPDDTTKAIAETILDESIAAWGSAIVTLAHAYDPRLVVVSGGIMRSQDIVLPRLIDWVHTNLWSSCYRPPFVVPDQPEYSVVLGMSALAAAAADSTPSRSERANP